MGAGGKGGTSTGSVEGSSAGERTLCIMLRSEDSGCNENPSQSPPDKARGQDESVRAMGVELPCSVTGTELSCLRALRL